MRYEHFVKWAIRTDSVKKIFIQSLLGYVRTIFDDIDENLN